MSFNGNMQFRESLFGERKSCRFMGTELLSIIIPIYNSENYLEKCVCSVLAQTYSNFQLILVNDASTDHSGQICDKLAAMDKRIEVLHHTKNKGLSLSREDGLNSARGKWISFMDNDDYICPFMYERLMRQADKGDMICIRGEDRTSEEIDKASWDESWENQLIYKGKQICDLIYSKSLDLGFIEPIWGKIIKRSLIDYVLNEVSVYKKRLYWVFMEDVLFTPLLFYYAEDVVIDNVLMYLHRRILNNLSSTLIPTEYHYEAVEAGDVLLSFFKDKGMQKAYPRYLIGFFMLAMSTWYKVWKNEKNQEKRHDYNCRLTELYAKYEKDIRKVKCHSISETAKKTMVLGFNTHRVLWGRTIGKLYFELGRKKSY